MQENLKAKYGITDEKLKTAIAQIDYGKIACDGMTLMALDDLLKRGDIKGNATQSKIVFESAAHEQFYNEQLAKCYVQDVYHRTLMYTLGISDDTRRHINEIYDFDDGVIKIKALRSAWVTSGDSCVMRLAFNLFTDRVPEERNKERYAVGELFSHGYLEYLCQAVMIRYGGVG